MRTSVAVILTGVFLPSMVFAAIPRAGSGLPGARSSSSSSSSSRPRGASAEQLAADKTCRESTGYTDEQLKRASLLEIFRKCVATELASIRGDQEFQELQEEKQAMIEKAKKTIDARFRGRDPNQPVTKPSPGKPRVRKVTKRVSPRTLKAKLWEQQQSSASSSSSSSSQSS